MGVDARGRNGWGRCAAAQNGVWGSLLRHSSPANGGPESTTTIMEADLDGHNGNSAWDLGLYGSGAVDGFDSRAGFYHAGKFHELADVVFYEGVRQNVARTHGIHLEQGRASCRIGSYIDLRGYCDGSPFALAPKAGRGRPSVPVSWLGCRGSRVSFASFTSYGAAFLRWIVFPKDMVLIVGLAAAACWWVCYRRGFSDGTLTIGILLTFPALLAFRMLMGMESWGYPIYYNGTVILAFLFLGSRLIVPDPGRSRTFEFRAELVVCCCCLSWVVTHTDVFVAQHTDLAPLITERGVIKTQKHMVVNYQKAIAFMKERAAAGDSVLSIPEDTSLYFLTGTQCPIRVSQFTPGVLVPGKMTEDVIGEIERKKIPYLLWSNRTFAEYGVPVFGRSYDTYFADYLTSHYCPVGPVFENKERGWNAVVWKRMTDEIESR